MEYVMMPIKEHLEEMAKDLETKCMYMRNYAEAHDLDDLFYAGDDVDAAVSYLQCAIEKLEQAMEDMKNG